MTLRIAVGGCLVQKDKALVLRKAPWVDAAFGTFAVGELPGLLRRRERTGVPAFEFRDRATPMRIAKEWSGPASA